VSEVQDRTALTGADPFLDAISYKRALRHAFDDEDMIAGLATAVHVHKSNIGWFPVTVPSWVLVRLIDNVHKKALADERRKLLMFGIEIEQQRMKREAAK
jgi:hypothetical protein